MTKKQELKKLELEAHADGFNAGYGKKVRRVIFCKEAKEYVLQEKVGINKWLCLHK